MALKMVDNINYRACNDWNYAYLTCQSDSCGALGSCLLCLNHKTALKSDGFGSDVKKIWLEGILVELDEAVVKIALSQHEIRLYYKCSGLPEQVV